MVDINVGVNSSGSGNNSRCLVLILIIILNLNGLILSQPKHKADFEQGTSYQSKSYKKTQKIPPGAAIGPNGDVYVMQERGSRLTCFKISEGGKDEDEKLWEQTFDSKIKKLSFDRKSGDRIEVNTEISTWRGDVLKGNFVNICFLYTSGSPLNTTKPPDIKVSQPSTEGISISPVVQETGISFAPAASYQSKLHKKRKKFIPTAAISPNGDYCVMKDGESHLTCFKISIGQQKEDEKMWEKEIGSEILKIRFDQKGGDSVYVVTPGGTLKGDVLKGGFSYIIKEKKLQDIAHSPGGNIYAASKGKDLILGYQKTGDVSIRNSRAHKRKIKFLDFISKDRLLTIGEDNITKVWNKNNRDEIMNRKIHPGRIQAAALTFDRKYLVMGIYDFKINIGLSPHANPSDVKDSFKLRIIDTSDLSKVKEIKGIKTHFSDISISADNKFAAVLTKDQEVDIWDLEHSKVIYSFSGGTYSDVEFGPLGKTFILVTQAGKIQRWITKGIIVRSARPQYVGKKYKINTLTAPIITKKDAGITVAVLDFSALSIDPKVAKSVSGSFKSKISNYSYISVVERDRIYKILKEQGLQHSGLTLPIKAAEIGKILNAQKLIIGTLKKFGSTLVVTVDVVDVQTAKVDGGREVECQNYEPENIPEMIETLLSILIEK